MAIWHFGEDEDNVLDMRRSASTHNSGKKPDKLIGNFNILSSCPWDKFLLSKFLDQLSQPKLIDNFISSDSQDFIHPGVNAFASLFGSDKNFPVMFWSRAEGKFSRERFVRLLS